MPLPLPALFLFLLAALLLASTLAGPPAASAAPLIYTRTGPPVPSLPPAPAITSVFAYSADSYSAAFPRAYLYVNESDFDSVYLFVRFSERVFVNTSAGRPFLLLNTASHFEVISRACTLTGANMGRKRRAF